MPTFCMLRDPLFGGLGEAAFEHTAGRYRIFASALALQAHADAANVRVRVFRGGLRQRGNRDDKSQEANS